MEMEMERVGGWGQNSESEEGLLNSEDAGPPNPLSRTPGPRGHLLRQFAEISSMRAVPRIVRAPSLPQRALWTIALLAGVTMTTYQLFRLLGTYFCYRTSIHMLNAGTPSPIPDITVCNLNPTWELNASWTYDDYLRRLEDYLRDYPRRDDLYLAESLRTYEGYLQYFSGEQLAGVRDGLVWDCRWEAGEVSVSCWEGVSRHVSPYYGPCTTIHRPPGIPSHSSRLSMMLFVNDFTQNQIQDFVLSSYYTYSSGVRVLVHPPGTFPLMDEGVNLPPGHESTITARPTRRELIGPPYGTCSRAETVPTRHSAPGEEYTYTDRVCHKFCTQDYIIDTCGCVDPFSPFPKSYRDLEEDFCGLLDLDDTSSINQTLDKLACVAGLSLVGVCDCPQPCSHLLYDIEVSQVPWPHVNYHMAFYKKYIAPSDFSRLFSVYDDIARLAKTDPAAAFGKLRKTDLLRRNFLEVSVLVDGEQTRLMEDYPNLSLEALFGNMGGILNLWVGITFVTAVELMDLLWVCLTGNRNRLLVTSGPNAHPPATGNAEPEADSTARLLDSPAVVLETERSKSA